MFTFQWPWLILLLPLPLLLLLWPYRQPSLEKTVPQLRFFALRPLNKALQSVQSRPHPHKTIGQSILLWLAWFGLVASLMYPQWLDKHVEITQEGYDLMLAVDLSGSMETLDFHTQQGQRINRFEAVKYVLSPFIAKRLGDRIGLILFADQAFLQSPLTLDTQAVQALLQRAVLGMAGKGTAIGDAIGLAVKKLRQRPAGSRILILLTDGENNTGQLAPRRAAKLAKQYDIRVFTIGVGRPTSPLARSLLDEKLLKEIAKLTGGSYFSANGLQALDQVYEIINETLEKTEAESRIYLQLTPLYHFPLSFALIALLGWQLLRIIHPSS